MHFEKGWRRTLVMASYQMNSRYVRNKTLYIAYGVDQNGFELIVIEQDRVARPRSFANPGISFQANTNRVCGPTMGENIEGLPYCQRVAT